MTDIYYAPFTSMFMFYVHQNYQLLYYARFTSPFPLNQLHYYWANILSTYMCICTSRTWNKQANKLNTMTSMMRQLYSILFSSHFIAIVTHVKKCTIRSVNSSVHSAIVAHVNSICYNSSEHSAIVAHVNSICYNSSEHSAIVAHVNSIC